jgi:hypothetical protein
VGGAFLQRVHVAVCVMLPPIKNASNKQLREPQSSTKCNQVRWLHTHEQLP